MEEVTSELPNSERLAPKGAKKSPKKSAAALTKSDGEKPDLLRALGETIAILSRDKRFRHLTLAELETIVIPALVTSQLVVFRSGARPNSGAEDQDAESLAGVSLPIGLALWASVSDAVSEKLERQKFDGAPFRLAPNEWKSGANLWLLATVGPDKIKPELKAKLEDSIFSGKDYRDYTVGGTKPQVSPEVPE